MFKTLQHFAPQKTQPLPRSNMPGYGGYIPSARAENLYGTTYGGVTRQVNWGRNSVHEERFKSTNYNNNLYIQKEVLRSVEKKQRFWDKSYNLNALDRRQNSTKLNYKLNHEKFVPVRETKLTYEEAIKSKK